MQELGSCMAVHAPSCYVATYLSHHTQCGTCKAYTSAFLCLPPPLQALTSKDKIAHMKESMTADVAKAMGRLSSGLYIVSAQQENARRCANSTAFVAVS